MLNLRNKIVWLLFVLALIGIADTTYLTVNHINGTAVACSITKGCGSVLNSQYSKIGGIPLFVYGLGYYGLMLILIVAYVDSGKRGLVKAIAIIAGLATLAMGYFTYVQAFILHAFCQYCLLSALITVLLLITSITFYRQLNKNINS